MKEKIKGDQKVVSKDQETFRKAEMACLKDKDPRGDMYRGYVLALICRPMGVSLPEPLYARIAWSTRWNVTINTRVFASLSLWLSE